MTFHFPASEFVQYKRHIKREFNGCEEGEIRQKVSDVTWELRKTRKVKIADTKTAL